MYSLAYKEGIIMTTYVVTAANKFYWQTLCVKAASIGEAAYSFTEYLAAPQQQDDERYEYNEQCKIVNDRLDSEDWPQPDREDYFYDFENDDIEENDAILATAQVRMIESGGS